MKAALLILALAWSIQTGPPQTTLDPSLVRVFVQTDDSGHPDELAARRESMKQLLAALATRKKTIAIVDDEDKADLTIDVLGRGLTVPRVVFGSATMTGQRPSPASTPTRVVELRVKLNAERVSDPIEIKNKNRPVESEPGWKSAADDIAKQIEKWVGEHRAKIFEARK